MKTVKHAARTASSKRPRARPRPPAQPAKRSKPLPAHRDPRRRARVEKAVGTLLAAFGYPTAGELAETPQRVADLWLGHLLAGDAIGDPRDLPKRSSRATSNHPVSVMHLGVYLVCPHHLTIAFGQAHLAYIPTDLVAGFGALSDLVTHFTARLTLQEDATQAIAHALVEHLRARAAVVVITATHPCHNILHPRSHGARAITWAHAGEARGRRALRSALQTALAHAGRTNGRTPSA